MLKSILLDSFLLFLTVYAIMDLASRLVKFCWERINGSAFPNGYCVLYLQTGSHAVEPTVRENVARAKRQKLELVLVDVSLSDEERAVAKLLCREYENLILLNREEYLRFVEQQMTSLKT